MNLETMRENLRDMRETVNSLSARLAQAAAGGAPMNDVNDLQQRLKEARARYDLVAEECRRMEQAQQTPQALSPAPEAQQPRGLKDMLASREYARAFAAALRGGANPGRPETYRDAFKPVFDAMTIAGGTPAGADGGFLVPEDVDNTIRALRRELSPVSALFNQETVTTNSGWRVVDTAPTKGFTALTGEIPSGGIAKDDQPAFSKISYSLTTYGLIVPISNELAQDEDANLLGYLGRWFGRKLILTENKLLLDLLAGLTATNVALASENALDAVKAALNVALDPEISRNAALLTNQDGYNILDQLKDSDGRPLLQPDPTNATGYLIKGRPVHILSNAHLPTVTKTKEGQTADGTEGDYTPLYIGDFRAFGTLFRRAPLEMRATDIGGTAFSTNSLEVRGIARMAAKQFDGAAAVARKLFKAAAGA